MILYRLCKSAFANDLSGKGAEQSGGRWNSKGTPMIYTGSSRALCMAEVAVHLPLYLVPVDYRILSIEIPDSIKAEILAPAKLTSGWKKFPYNRNTQVIGDAFVKAEKHLLLKVPSAVVQDEFNFLINPRHKDISKVKIMKNEAFSFDERILGRPFDRLRDR